MYPYVFIAALDGDGGLCALHWITWVKVYMEDHPEAEENFGYISYQDDTPLQSVEDDVRDIVRNLATKHTVFCPFSDNHHAFLVIVTADTFYAYVNGPGPVPRRAVRLYEGLQKKTEKKRAFVELRSPVQRGGMDCVAFSALMATHWMEGTKFTQEVAAREIPEFRGKLKKLMLEGRGEY